MLKLLFLGDLVGKPGRTVVSLHLAELIDEHKPDLVIANGENAAGGLGIDQRCAREIFTAGVDVITTGNHVWQRKDLRPYLESNSERIIRPLNFPIGAPGSGWASKVTNGNIKVGIVNLIGRVFMPQLVDCPFQEVEKLLEGELKDSDVIMVDFHAEATSEKLAMGYFLDGKVSLVAGTHTHIQTADNRILPKGTGFIADVGMCGPSESVIGVKSELVVNRFVSGLPSKFEVAGGKTMINGVVVEVDETTGNACSVSRIYEVYGD